MKNPSTLLPLQFGQLASFKKVTWDDFKGEVDQTMPWKAHIYWYIDYKITDKEKKKVSAKLYISPKTWVREQVKSDHLLNHEQGHYLIGALCVLEFLRRVDKKKHYSNKVFDDLVSETFERTMKEYLEMEIRYDNETEHRLNFKKQEEWDSLLYDKLFFYTRIFDKKKGKFVKLSESSPSKNR